MKVQLTNNDFNKLWFGETISMFGAQLTTLAIPLVAVILLNASPMEMGLLTAFSTLPFFLFSLFIGIIVDNNKRKPLLIIANIGSMIFLTNIAIFYWFDLLTIYILCIIQFLLASMAVLFELTYLSYVPSLVEKENLSGSNSKLEGSRAVAQMGGPGLGGILIQVFSAPVAIIIDVFSYLISTISLFAIRTEEDVVKSNGKIKIFSQIKEGLLVLIKHKILMSISSATALLNFFGSAFAALYVIYVVENLLISPTLLGIILGLGSVGALIGAFIATVITKKMGIGKSILIGSLFSGLGVIIVPLAPDTLLVSTPLLILAQLFIGLGGTIYFISQVTLRQTITPTNLLGRVNASNRFITRGFMPLGAILGGALASVLNIKIALLIISLGAFTPALFIGLSPIIKIFSTKDAIDNYKVG